MKNLKQFLSILIMLFMSISLFGQFKAKMVFKTMGNERIFAIYSSGAGYRYEFEEDGQEGAIIVKKGSQKVIILMPQQKMAMISPVENPMSIGNDPISAFEYYKKDGTLKELGKETINGIECMKSELWNITGDEYGQVKQKMFTMWYSDKYKFPVKLINHIDGSEGSGMEIQDIELWIPDANSYSIPEGYQIMEMGDMMQGMEKN
ncbi:MAG: hypothetical protein U9N53_11645 [Bacteroidota bacterium]|nr:hypothetical protein [Bacteroidota bacterium]